MAKENNKEVTRLLPGTLVMQKDTHQFGVVQYSYADKYGGDDYESLSIMWLKTEICSGHSSSWHNASNFIEVPFEEMLFIYYTHYKNMLSQLT
jgi:hypothetical protein